MCMNASLSTAASRPHDLGSEAVTTFEGGGAGGVRVRVRPEYLPEHSDPAASRYVFGYRVRVTNESAEPVTLISRHWMIVDGDGDRHEVQGDGVVGRQPRLEPGEAFDYASFCPLETRWGTMEGVYHMRCDNGAMFDATVARFFLVAPESSDLL